MTTVAQVLADHDIAASERDVATELRALLDGAGTPRPAALTADEDEFLARHGGVGRASRRQLATLAARSGALAVREVVDSLSRNDTAQRLGIAASRVSHRVAAGQLYSYPGAGRRRRFPSWQFVDGTTLPQLDVVVAALPPGAHPALVRSFMTTPLDSLRLHGRAVDPVRWLVAGGAADPVAEAARDLGEQD